MPAVASPQSGQPAAAAPVATPAPRSVSLNARQSLAYGLLGLPLAFVSLPLYVLLPHHYAREFGLPLATLGALLLAARLADALIDPFIGHLSDRTYSRWGRRLPWLYIAPIPLGIAWYFLWSPPIEGPPSFWLLLGMAVLIRLLLSACEVPSVAIVPELTADYDERTIVMRYRFLFGWGGGLLILLLAYGVFFGGEKGLVDPDGYFPYALTGALMMLGAVVISAAGQHRRIAVSNLADVKPVMTLRQVLGEHVQQKGSLVDSQRLRFDFSHFEAIKPEQLKALEDIVNREIRLNSAVETEETDIETAKAKGAMALFGEKYGDNVRVLSMGGGFSVELCGGIHAARTGDIALFKITSEGGVAAGVRRIEAVTGAPALAWLNAAEEQLKEAAALVKGNRDNVLDKLSALLERNRLLEKELEQLKAKAASAAGDDMSAAAVEVKGVKVLAARLDGLDGKALLALVDQLKNKLGSAVILLGGVQDDKVVLVAGVTQDLTAKLKAGELMKQAAAAVGGKGGGRPDMAQGGGTDAAALDGALELARAFVEQGL